jgi:hypothetical protein
MGAQLRLFVLYALCGNMLLGQGVRDEWRQMGSFDLEAHLSSSLANANLSDQERSQIYSLIDNKTIHDSFSDDQRNKDRETVLSARVGLISLTDGQSQQIVARGPAITCGHSWNCSIWILARDNGGLHLLLRTGGGAFIISKTSHRGFHNIATAWHISAEEEAFGVFQWDGRQYTQVDCYSARFDLADRNRPPKLESCPGRSQRTPPQH